MIASRCRHDIRPPVACAWCTPPTGCSPATAWPVREPAYDRSTPWGRVLEALDLQDLEVDDPMEVDPEAFAGDPREINREQRHMQWWPT